MSQCICWLVKCSHQMLAVTVTTVLFGQNFTGTFARSTGLHLKVLTLEKPHTCWGLLWTRTPTHEHHCSLPEANLNPMPEWLTECLLCIKSYPREW